MNDNSSNLMEGGILAEENLSDQPPKKAGNQELKPTRKFVPKLDITTIKNRLSRLKKPRLITVSATFIVLVVSFALLAAFGSKKPQEVTLEPDILLTSPKPTPAVSAQVQQIYQDLARYEEKINGFSDSIKNYPPPKVDLEVKF